jgi:uncharacterized membrane protein (Fun14 family)
MGKLDVVWISSQYATALTAVKMAVKGSVDVLSKFISSCLMGMDGGLIGDLIGWAVTKVIEAVMDLESKALAIVLRVEYLVRAGRVSMQNAWKAYNLTNKCSKCRCIGHNKQNHDDALEKFLMAHNLYSAVNDAGDLVGAAEEDGWMDG